MEKSVNSMNLLFSGNDKVFDGILTCLLSIIHRSQLTEPLCVYVYTMDVSYIKPEYQAISDEQIDFLNQVIKGYDERHTVVKVDVLEIYKSEFANCPNEQCYCSPYTLLRLFADLVPGMPDKILYLDVDILFNRDIALLYNIDISEYEYAAARDHYGKYLIHPNYMNAGVLLFNLKKMKETGLLVRARQLIKTKKLAFADQSAIYRSTTKKRMLPQRFNDQKFLHKHTVVRHFSKRLFYLPYPHTANIKQWNVEGIHRIFHYHQWDDVLEEYIKLKEKYHNGELANV
jgi:lipopolysaccharide biosynthesis glycosyltransferase